MCNSIKVDVATCTWTGGKLILLEWQKEMYENVENRKKRYKTIRNYIKPYKTIGSRTFYGTRFIRLYTLLYIFTHFYTFKKIKIFSRKFSYMSKSAKPSQFLCHETGKNFFLEHTSRTSFFSIFIQYIMRNNSWTSQSGFVTTFFLTFSIKSDFFQLQEKCWKITLFQMPAILTGRIIQKF